MTTTDETAVKQTARTREGRVRGLLLLWVGVGFVYFIVQLDGMNPVLLMAVWGVVFAVLLVVANTLHARGKP